MFQNIKLNKKNKFNKQPFKKNNKYMDIHL